MIINKENEDLAGEMNETLKRVLTAVIIVPLLLLAVFTPEYNSLAFTIVVLATAVLMTLELLSIADVKGIPNYWIITLLSVISIIVIEYFTIANQAINKDSINFITENKFYFIVFFIIFISTIIVFFFESMKTDFSKSLETVSVHVFTLLYCGFAPVFFLKIQKIDPNHLIFVWLLTWMTDTGAYFSGKYLGKHNVNLAASPKKTWEGFIGGVIIAVLSGVLLKVINPGFYNENTFSLYSYQNIILLGFFLSILTIIGDLAESVIKRSSGVKDSKTYIPGHGGILDVIDSMVYTSPVFFLIFKILN